MVVAIPHGVPDDHGLRRPVDRHRGLRISVVVAGLLITQFGAAPVPALVGGVVACGGIGLVKWRAVHADRLVADHRDPGDAHGPALASAVACTQLDLRRLPDRVRGGSIHTACVLGIRYFGIAEAIVVLVGAFVLAWSPVADGTLLRSGSTKRRHSCRASTHAGRSSACSSSAGAMAGVAGAMRVPPPDSAPSGSLGVGFELDVLTAVLLGGVAFNGGRGTIRGVVLGVLFLAILWSCLILLNVPTAFGLVIKGGALVFAAIWIRQQSRRCLSSRVAEGRDIRVGSRLPCLAGSTGSRTCSTGSRIADASSRSARRR